mmetsp:Transcript_46618/g.123135  ORF Transcript_46618/g.123135 Transcript_46618/m.123135 type:complete len:203 (-) Transcript_46618:636-1244(-)
MTPSGCSSEDWPPVGTLGWRVHTWTRRLPLGSRMCTTLANRLFFRMAFLRSSTVASGSAASGAGVGSGGSSCNTRQASNSSSSSSPSGSSINWTTTMSRCAARFNNCFLGMLMSDTSSFSLGRVFSFPRLPLPVTNSSPLKYFPLFKPSSAASLVMWSSNLRCRSGALSVAGTVTAGFEDTKDRGNHPLTGLSGFSMGCTDP